MKRNSIILFFVTCCLISLIFIPSTSAGTGSAAIPFWVRDPNYLSFFNVSNISNSQITVCIKLFSHDGTSYTNNIQEYLGFNGNPTSANCATLAAGSTGQMVIYNVAGSSNTNGWGRISWTSAGDQLVSALAFGGFQVSTSTNIFPIQINGGNPF